jgi:DNA-binding PadR family transcriptional regulator
MDLGGQLEFVLLAGLERCQPVHGYALITAVRELSADAFDLAEGTVYPTLRRLEARGWVASEWDTTSPRPRRVYEVTQSGREALAAKQRDWFKYRQAVDGVVSNVRVARA